MLHIRGWVLEKIDRRPRPFVSKLFGKYEVVYRPLRVENGVEIVEVFVEKPLDDMQGVWVELVSGTVVENIGYDETELLDILDILNSLGDLIYVDASDAAAGKENARKRISLFVEIFKKRWFNRL